MQRHITTSFTILLLLMTGVLQAQLPTTWVSTMDNTVFWQRTNQLGNLIVSTRGGLYGVDTETGQTLWHHADLANVAEESFQEIPGSPFFTVSPPSRPDALWLIEPLSGKIVFDSEAAGLREVNRFYFLYTTGIVIIKGKNSDRNATVLGVDMGTGKVLWSNEEDFGALHALLELESGDFIATSTFYLYRVNPSTGEITWKTAVDPQFDPDKMGKLAGFLGKLADNAAEQEGLNVELFMGPQSDVFYIGFQNESDSPGNGSGFSSSSGSGPYFNSGINAFSLSDGQSVWPAAYEYQGQRGLIAFDDRGLIVLPNDDSNTKINLLDYKTGEGKWGKKGNGLKAKGSALDYYFTDEGLLVTTGKFSATGNLNGFMNIIDLDAGDYKFEKWNKIKGAVTRTDIIDAGLVVYTSREFNIFDQQSGEWMYKSSIETNPALTASSETSIYAFDLSSSSLVAIDRSNGSMKPLSQRISFDGKESPTYVELRESGILIGSSQNLALVGFDGKTIYQQYLPAPRDPGILRALAFAYSVRAAYQSAALAAYSGAFSAAAADSESAAGRELGNQMSVAFADASAQAGSVASDAMALAKRRYTASRDLPNFVFILTQNDQKQKLLAIVDKDSGEMINHIDLGKDKTPNYEVDAVTGQVFYLNEPNQISSYKMD